MSVLACAALLGACSAPWSTHPATTVGSSTTAAPVAPTVIPTVESSPHARATPVATTVRSSPSALAPAPTLSPTPPPTPVVHQGPVAACCGVFSWADASHLVVFDAPPGGKQGTYLVNVQDGSRSYLSPVAGTPSSAGLIAFPNAESGVTEIRRTDGSPVSTIHNGGRVTWISPDGNRLAWLVDQAVPNTSSLVKRIVRLTTANVDGSNLKSLVEFQSSSLQWLPDNLHVLALARAQNGTRPGIWSVDTSTGTNGVVVAETYIQALRVSPDGSKMAYLVTFSGDPAKDGVWVSNVDGSSPVHLGEVGAFRWAVDSNHLWFLKLSAPGAGDDHLVNVDIATDSQVAAVAIGGRVLDGQWDVSPSGNIVAFWNEADQSVVVRALSP